MANVFEALKVDEVKVDFLMERSTQQSMKMEPISGILDVASKHEYF